MHNKYYCLLYLLLGLFALSSKANNPNHEIDALRKEIAVAKHDTTKCLHYLEIANKLRRTDVLQSLEFLDTAFHLAFKHNFNKGKGIFYFQHGKTLGIFLEYEQAIDNFDSAIYYFNTLKDIENIAYANLFKGMCQGFMGLNTAAFKTYSQGIALIDKDNNYAPYIALKEAIANVYNTMGLYDRAIDSYYDIIALAQLNNDLRMVNLSTANIGQTLAALSKYKQGLKLLLQAIPYFEENDETYQIIAILSNIGYIYGNLGDFNKAIEYYSKALQLSAGLNNLHEQLIFSKSISESQIELGNTEEAQKTLLKLIEKFNEIKDEDKVAETYTILGELFLDKKEYSKALVFLQKALTRRDKTEQQELQFKISFRLAKCYFYMHQLKQCKTYLMDSEKLALTLNNLDNLADVYHYFNQYYESKGDYKTSLFYYKKRVEILDSLNVEKQLSEVERIRFEFETEALKNEFKQSQALTKLENAKLEKKVFLRNIIILSIMILSVFVVVFLYLNIQKNKAKSKAKEAEMNLKVLHSQMNPHFIFNALASIHGYILSNNTEKAGAYLLTFSKLMRILLDQCRKSVVDLKSEITFLELYLSIESSRLHFTFDYQIDSDKIENLESIFIPPMMIQPFVENAIWHGFSKLKERKGHVSIHFTLDNNLLLVKIDDNGVGRNYFASQTQGNLIKKNKSHGVQIVEERLLLLNQEFDIEGKVAFNDKNQGLEVCLYLPFNFSF